MAQNQSFPIWRQKIISKILNPTTPPYHWNNDTNQKNIHKTNNNHEKNKKKQLQPSILEITSKPTTIIILYSFSIIPNFSQVGSQSTTSKLKKIKPQKFLFFSKKNIFFFFWGVFPKNKKLVLWWKLFLSWWGEYCDFFLMVKGLNQ